MLKNRIACKPLPVLVWRESCINICCS